MIAHNEPLDVGRIVYLANRKIYGYAFKTMLDPKTTLKVAEITAKANAPMIFIQYSKPKLTEKTAKGLVYLDFTEATSTPENILKEFKKSVAVEHVQLLKPTKSGVLTDTYFFPLILGDERIVIFRKSLYEGFIIGIKKQFGTAGEALLYYTGFDFGQRAYKYYKNLAITQDLNELGEIARALGATTGWMQIEPVNVNTKTKTAQIRLHNNFECELGKGNKKPYSHFLRGLIAGFFAGLFKQGVLVKEKKCIAKGDPYCEFEIRSKNK